MEDAFTVVVVAVPIVALVLGIATLGLRSRAYDEIGHGGLSIEAPPPPSPGSPAARDAEIRQMLAASNERRVRRGEAPLDVEAELARLTAAAPAARDPQLEAEVRQLVVAGNARRARRGEPPLDVEAEVRRRLDAFG